MVGQTDKRPGWIRADGLDDGHASIVCLACLIEVDRLECGTGVSRFAGTARRQAGGASIDSLDQPGHGLGWRTCGKGFGTRGVVVANGFEPISIRNAERAQFFSRSRGVLRNLFPLRDARPALCLGQPVL